MKRKLNCILLVDDNPDDNFMHKYVIEKKQITERVDVVYDGQAALDYLTNNKGNPPELIFLDINMPKMNGWEFLEEYKDLPLSQKSKVMIMMLTTSPNPSDRDRAMEIEELTGFQTKPLVESMIDDIMEKHFPELL